MLRRFRSAFGQKIEFETQLGREKCKQLLNTRFKKSQKAIHHSILSCIFTGNLAWITVAYSDWFTQKAEPKMVLYLHETASGTRLSGWLTPGFGTGWKMVGWFVTLAWFIVWVTGKLVESPPENIASPSTLLFAKFLITTLGFGIIIIPFIFYDNKVEKQKKLADKICKILRAEMTSTFNNFEN